MSRYPSKPDKARDKGKGSEEMTPKENQTPDKQEPEKKAKGRKPRVPLGTRNVLQYPQRPGYVRRVVNDVDDRVQRFKDAGYEIVHGDETGGDPMAGAASKIGSAVSKPVGGGRAGVLMEIPEEYYREDQAAKQAEIDKVESSMKRKSRPDQAEDQLGQYGNVSIS